MSPTERKKANWTVGTAITIGLLIWGGGAWVQGVKECNTRQDSDIIAASDKAIYAVEVVTEWRTRALLTEQRLEELEARVSNLEELEVLVRDIHRAVVR